MFSQKMSNNSVTAYCEPVCIKRSSTIANYKSQQERKNLIYARITQKKCWKVHKLFVICTATMLGYLIEFASIYTSKYKANFFNVVW